MALTDSLRAGVSDTNPVLLVDDDTVDRHVYLHLDGITPVRIGFTSAQVTGTSNGSFIPMSGIDFVLQAGDQLWAAGDATPGNGTSHGVAFVSVLVTK